MSTIAKYTDGSSTTFEIDKLGTDFKADLKLVSIEIGSEISKIDAYAFYGCTSLTSVTIPDSVKRINERAFLGCTSLTSITIGSGVTNIENNVFEGCTKLKTITCKSTTPPNIDSYTFYGIGNGGILNCPNITNYSAWLSNNEYYLKYYNWTGKKKTS